jgi:hypothetical protein
MEVEGLEFTVQLRRALGNTTTAADMPARRLRPGTLEPIPVDEEAFELAQVVDARLDEIVAG